MQYLVQYKQASSGRVQYTPPPPPPLIFSLFFMRTCPEQRSHANPNSVLPPPPEVSQDMISSTARYGTQGHLVQNAGGASAQAPFNSNGIRGVHRPNRRSQTHIGL